MSGHKDLVKAIRFLPSSHQDIENGAAHLLSGGDDHSVKLWKLDTRTGDAACVQTVVEHTAPVNCIATLKTDLNSTGTNKGTVFATGAADATIRIWHFDGATIRVLQTIKTASPKYFPLAVALSPLGGEDSNTFILAVAGTRPAIQIYTGSVTTSTTTDPTASPPTADFALRATLTGHEGWIRSLDFTREKANEPASDLLLASASQDKYIRLWRVHKGSELPAQAATASDPTVGAYLPGRSPSNKAHRFKTGHEGEDYSVTFESLLFNHDDWIYSAKWHMTPSSCSNTPSTLQLLSTSADNSLAIWESDPSSGIWVTTARLGEISREKGATTATGSIGGFWTGLWSPGGDAILTLGRTGSWRKWDWDATQRTWVQGIAVSGHVRAVTGIAWARPSGSYLLSTSADQTTRLHAQWNKTATGHTEEEKENKPNGGHNGTWHEMARPQIHGYDLNCIDALTETKFVSGADEKLMRVFAQPRAVARMLRGVAGIGGGPDSGAHDDDDAAVPDAANMPVLGLSNKATVDDFDTTTAAEGTQQPPQKQQPQLDTSSSAETREAAIDPATITRTSTLANLTHPPFEESLSRHTLWPEEEKLYGHGYELSCLAASHDGELVASACKASSLNHAVIRLFETKRWTELRPPLAVHTLTATRIRFSPDDGMLLSVGRDRQWAVFARQGKKGLDDGSGGSGFELLQAEPKGHTRMILDAAWAPLAAVGNDAEENEGERRIFATAGRDKNVKIWAMRKPHTTTDNDNNQQNEGQSKAKFVLAATIPCDQPVTAIDFLPRVTSDGQLVLASGTEAGTIRIHILKVRGGSEGGVEVSSTATLGSE